MSEPVASQQTGEVLEDDAGFLAQEPTDFLAEVGQIPGSASGPWIEIMAVRSTQRT